MHEPQNAALASADLGIDDLLVKFWVEAAQEGMHDQPMKLVEDAMQIGYSRGLAGVAIDDTLADFQQKATNDGMHDQYFALSERFIRDAYNKGRADAR